MQLDLQEKLNEDTADVRLALLLTHLARCCLDGSPLQLVSALDRPQFLNVCL